VLAIRFLFAYNRRLLGAALPGGPDVLTVTVQKLGESLMLRCRGRIVRGDETAILCSGARQNGQNIILDLTEVETIDAAGIGALVSLQAAGIYLKIMNPTEPVREILRITNLDSIFEIGSSEAGSAISDATGDSPEHAYHATLG
jgi:anti-anti-sigma factor